MYPAKYPHHATIKKPSTLQDNIGNELQTMEELGRPWVKIGPLSGREYVAARQTQAETTHKITLPTPDYAVDATCILEYGGKIYEFESVLDELEGGLIIMAKVRE